MINKPQFRRYLQVEPVAPNLVFLLAEGNRYVLEGEAYYQLAPHLNGQNSLTDIAQKLKGELSFFAIHQTVTRLHKQGYLIDAEVIKNETLARTVELFTNNAVKAEETINSSRLYIQNLSNSANESLIALFAERGIQVVSEIESATVAIVLVNDYGCPELETLNRDFLQQNVPWLLVKPVGEMVWLGPFFDAKETGCYRCLSHRLNLHRKVENFIKLQTNSQKVPHPPPTDNIITQQIAYSYVVNAVVKFLFKEQHETLKQNILVIDPYMLTMEKHHFIKRPQCPVCGDPDMIKRRAEKPIELQSRLKKYTADGGHRTMTPEQTVERLIHHVSNISGLVRVLYEMDDPSGGLMHTNFAGRNLYYVPRTFGGLQRAISNGDGGKGITAAQSKASGLCEALERYSAAWHGSEPRISASYNEISDIAVDPRQCIHFSERQYQMREEHNANPEQNPFAWVAPPFNPDEKIDWSPVWSLTQNRTQYLPTGYCYFDYKPGCATPACSNGSAAGNTLEEAIIQGFMEIVERDAVGIWWYNKIQRAGIALDTFPSPYIQDLVKYYDQIGYDLWALDLTSDLDEVKVFSAIGRRRAGVEDMILLGFGAHFDPMIAMLRAVTEVNQSLSPILAFDSPPFGDTAKKWWETARVDEQPYLLPHPDLPMKTFADFQWNLNKDILDDVNLCIEMIRKRNMNLLVLDTTQPDVDLSVVKVFVPGLRHFWRRLAPGRLYDIPVQMGWLNAPKAEEELNEYDIYF